MAKPSSRRCLSIRDYKRHAMKVWYGSQLKKIVTSKVTMDLADVCAYNSARAWQEIE